MVMGRGVLALVLASIHPLWSSDVVALDEGMNRPLPMPAFMSFWACTWPLPTPAPINMAFGEEGGCCWITLHTSPLATLAEEVLTLGVGLSEADKFVSAADEETIMVGIILPATTWDGGEGGSTTKGCSCSPSPAKAGKPATFGLTGVGNGVTGD